MLTTCVSLYYQGLLFLFLVKRNDFGNKSEEFYNPSIKKVLRINDIPYQLSTAILQIGDIYPELKMCFYKEHFNVTWEGFLTTEFGL